jgi:hypothetical protein
VIVVAVTYVLMGEINIRAELGHAMVVLFVNMDAVRMYATKGHATAREYVNTI